MKIATALLFAALSSAVCASNMRTAIAKVEPTINVSNGEVVGCGVRLILIEADGSGGSRYMVDSSLGFFGMSGVLKAGLSSAAVSVDKKVSSQRHPAQSIWISVGDASPVKAAPIKPAQSDDAGFLIQALDPASTMEAVMELIQGSEVVIGIRPLRDDRDVVLAATISADETTSKRVVSCMKTMIERLEKQAKEQ